MAIEWSTFAELDGELNCNSTITEMCLRRIAYLDVKIFYDITRNITEDNSNIFYSGLTASFAVCIFNADTAVYGYASHTFIFKQLITCFEDKYVENASGVT